MLELFQMWALVEVLGLACLPLTITIFHNLPDRGWAFNKALGIVILAFCVWLPLMLFPSFSFSQFFILGVALDMLALNLFGLIRLWSSVKQLLQIHLRYIIITELLFFGMILLLGWIRSYGPTISSYEMFMDEGIIASIMRSSHFPPNDMWFSGQSLNYYYYAHYTVAVLAKLLGQSPSIAFNTGICMFFGLCAVNLFGVTCNVVAWARSTRLRKQSGATQPLSTSLLPAVPYGLLSMLMALIFGNLAATRQWWQSHDSNLFSVWFGPSRVLGPQGDTINEFPAFSFLLSCFHAHVLTLAFTILTMGLIFNLFLSPTGKGLLAFGRGWRLPLNLGVTALVIGGLFAMNSWDYPTYIALTCLCLCLQQWLAHDGRFSFVLLRDVLVAVISLVGLSLLLYLPFYLHFSSPSEGFALVTAALRSQLSDELLIYGLFAFVFLSLLLASVLKHPLTRHQLSLVAPPTSALPQYRTPPLTPVFADLASLSGERNTPYTLPATLPSSVTPRAPGEIEQLAHATTSPLTTSVSVAVATHDQLPATEQVQTALRPSLARIWLFGTLTFLALCLCILKFVPNSATFVVGSSLAALGGALALYHLKERSQAFVLLLGASAFALVAFCEVFYLKDVFANGSYERMNTVFKYYFQAWALLSVACGAGLYFVIDALRSLHTSSKVLRWTHRSAVIFWSSVGLLLALASLVYPLTAPYARYAQINGSQTFLTRTDSLDGMVYLKQQDPGDYAAIRWLNAHIAGDPVIVEAMGNDYSYYGRISTFTGLPTLMGWYGHEYQWRFSWLKNPANNTNYQQRGSDIDQIYTNPNAATVLALLHHYDAQYVYVGALEAEKYPHANLQRFASFMQIVYNASGVTIYKVR